MIPNIATAVLSLANGADFILRGDTYSGLEWLDTVKRKPTQSEIDAEIVRLQVIYNANEYARKRAPEYPPLTDLADALYHQSKGDETKLTAYLAKCEAVKQKYPKE